MKKTLFILSILILLTWFWGAFQKIIAAEELSFEDSDPYILLEADKNELDEEDTVSFIIRFGNKGNEDADNVKVIFNQPLGSRSALEYISSEPAPDDWINSEYGNLAEFIIGNLQTFEATEEARIELKARVRESVAPQKLTPTANLQAPHREPGKRLVVSEPVYLQINGQDSSQVDEQNIEKQATASQRQISNATESVTQEITPTEIPKKIFNLGERIMGSEAIWTTAAFLIISLLIIFAFITGRKSKGNLKQQ